MFKFNVLNLKLKPVVISTTILHIYNTTNILFGLSERNCPFKIILPYYKPTQVGD